MPHSILALSIFYGFKRFIFFTLGCNGLYQNSLLNHLQFTHCEYVDSCDSDQGSNGTTFCYHIHKGMATYIDDLANGLFGWGSVPFGSGLFRICVALDLFSSVRVYSVRFQFGSMLYYFILSIKIILAKLNSGRFDSGLFRFGSHHLGFGSGMGWVIRFGSICSVSFARCTVKNIFAIHKSFGKFKMQL